MANFDDGHERAPERSNVPALINDYRAQMDAWRAQRRGLDRMREEVLAAADREARDIVTATQADVRQILAKARRDLLMLATQVEAATDTSQASGPGNHAGDADAAGPAQLDDLRAAHDVFASARHDVHRVIDDVRPELEALSSDASALRSILQRQLSALNEAPSRVVTPPNTSLQGQPLALDEAPRVVIPPDLAQLDARPELEAVSVEADARRSIFQGQLPPLKEVTPPHLKRPATAERPVPRHLTRPATAERPVVSPRYERASWRSSLWAWPTKNPRARRRT